MAAFSCNRASERRHLGLTQTRFRAQHQALSPAYCMGRSKFAETVAVSRGLNVRVFPTVREAAAWLEGE